ncbi:unnamed protein product [Rotaria sp. Silwood2]|nr:unnamed protein product [Rotaria sp. Silwood2]CAF2974613.1 unnamed protein product [Rotaria sp. Silwood2]CAF3295214.1 unnamed protein product [Rotaria sp. Silwood2]CAF4435662.1 unnamed protein product [Rotaria sp. Silwood2]CAF4455553.1 unnamed protein product [Rotaria sp. Silwood2]
MSMLVSSRLLPPALPSSPMTIFDNNIDHSHQTNSTSLPKYFNVPFAIQHGYFRCIRYLLQLHYDPNERDSQLRTPLILCSYVENDRWSLSLAQNLLEKGAKIALEDNARRNAMHHACALQRFHLVQLYLSCLDFNIEAKDCEGNTCLHYAAITGNSGIAELIIRSAEKLNIRLDQYVNREGCSAAALALKYGHIDCANQITHRDWDEFYVVPRPLSIYESPSTTDDNQTTTKKTKMKNNFCQSSEKKLETRPSTLSFGLLKIIFNDSDTCYSNRLAGLCKQAKQSRHRQHLKHPKHEAPQTATTTINKLDRTKSTLPTGAHYCSTEAVVNETQSLHKTKEHQKNFDTNLNLNNSNRTSPRIQLFIQQQQQQIFNKSNLNDQNSSFIQKTTSKTQLSVDDLNQIQFNSSKNDNEETKSKIRVPTIYPHTSNSTLNHSEHNTSRIKNKFQNSTTSIINNQTYVNSSTSHINSAKIKPTHILSASTKKKPVLIDQFDSVSNIPKHHYSIIGSDSSTYSQSMYAGRPISAIVHHSNSKSNDSSCSIREATGVTCRYNKPEELFGLRPEELFAPEQYQPKILDQHSAIKTNENTRLKRNQLQKQQHIWQNDVDKILDLYNVHHCTNYRKSAIPPSTTTQTDTTSDSINNGRPRRMSITKNSSTNVKQPTNPKQSTFASLNIPRRNSISRPSIKLTNA